MTCGSRIFSACAVFQWKGNFCVVQLNIVPNLTPFWANRNFVAVGGLLSRTLSAFVSFLLIHFFLFLGFSFVPASQWNSPVPTPASAQHASPSAISSASPSSNSNQGPPPILF